MSRADHRPLPGWWADAKLGILVHWGPYSVPAFAPVGPSPFALAESHGWAHAFAHTPYAEWYENSLSLEGSPVARHHAEHHADETYGDLAERFRRESTDWDPATWTEPFAAAGARYVVITTKHHDGFCLWPTAVPTPHRADWSTERDLVGDLAAATRQAGMRFGTYYSGGLDWTFGGLGIDSFEAMIAAIPRSDEYRRHAAAHVRELIARYEPDVLWNDIHFPGRETALALIEHFHEVVPHGVVNDRFDLRGVARGEFPADVVTPEYAAIPPETDLPWELCRGIGGSFGLNDAETTDDLLTGRELVHLLIEVVAAGGNLLLGVGPAADGSIPSIQADRLAELAGWIRTNGAAVHGTRPGTSDGGRPVTVTDTDRHVFVLDPEPGAIVELEGEGPVELLGHGRLDEEPSSSGSVAVRLPRAPAPSPAAVLRLHGGDA
ncbi:MAG: alpha-L-fucosidase [Actinomycetota bacterium]